MGLGWIGLDHAENMNLFLVVDFPRIGCRIFLRSKKDFEHNYGKPF